MGNVVSMPLPRRRRAAAGRKTDEATILLFIGVRYVRELDSAERKSLPSPKSVRDAVSQLDPMVVA